MYSIVIDYLTEHKTLDDAQQNKGLTKSATRKFHSFRQDLRFHTERNNKIS